MWFYFHHHHPSTTSWFYFLVWPVSYYMVYHWNHSYKNHLNCSLFFQTHLATKSGWTLSSSFACTKETESRWRNFCNRDQYFFSKVLLSTLILYTEVPEVLLPHSGALSLLMLPMYPNTPPLFRRLYHLIFNHHSWLLTEPYSYLRTYMPSNWRMFPFSDHQLPDKPTLAHIIAIQSTTMGENVSYE